MDCVCLNEFLKLLNLLSYSYQIGYNQRLLYSIYSTFGSSAVWVLGNVEGFIEIILVYVICI